MTETAAEQGLEVRVYESDGVTRVASPDGTLPLARGIRWHDPVGNVPGWLEFSVPLEDERTGGLDSWPPKWVKLYHVASQKEIIGGAVENFGETATRDGKEWLDLHVDAALDVFSHATTYRGPGALRLAKDTHRPLGHMNPDDQAWYVGGEWAAPGNSITSAAYYAAGNVGLDGWLELDPDAELIYTEGEFGDFRGIAEVTVPDNAAGGMWLRVFSGGDDAYNVWFGDSELTRTTDAGETWKRTVKSDVFWADSGLYAWAFLMPNQFQPVFEGPAGGEFVGSVYEVDELGNPTGTVLARTTTSSFLVSYNVQPGYYRASILLQLHSEAVARGVDAVACLTPDFDDTEDSAGVAHTERIDYRVPLFNEQMDATFNGVCGAKLEQHVDVDATASGVMAWQVFHRQGEVRTDVELTLGEYVGSGGNLKRLSMKSSGVVATRLLAINNEGVVTERYHGAQESAGWRIEGGIPLGSVAQTDSAAGILDAKLAETAFPRVEFTVNPAANGPQPYVDYFKGDTIVVPRPGGGKAAARVMALTGEMTEAGLSIWPEVIVDSDVDLEES